MMAPRSPATAVEVRPVDDEAAPPSRLIYLDNVKIVLTAGVIAAHAAMTYGAVGTWVYEESSLSDVTGAVLSGFVGLGVMFGLGLFFLMGGMLTTAPLRQRGPRRFLVSRIGRLGLPLLAYATIVWPVLRWLSDRAEGDTQSLAGFYRAELAGTRWQSLGTGPLWFVAILLVVSVAWSLWRWARPAPSSAGAGPLELRHLATTAAVIAAATFLVRIWFPVNSPQFLDVHIWMWPQSAALFVLGAMASERGWLAALADDLRRDCHRAALGAVAALAVMIVLSSGPDAFKGGWHWEAAGFAGFEGVFSVSVSLIVLDRFRRRHAHQGALGRTLANAAYGAFVAQGPVLVLLALALRTASLAGDVKFLLLAPTSVAASFGLAALARAVLRRRHGSRQPPAAIPA